VATDDDLSRVLREAIRDARSSADDDEQDWLRRATRSERRVIGDFESLENDLEGPSEGGTAIEREGLRSGKPKITGVEPEEFGPGDLVTIYGKNLFGVQQVLFDNKPAKQMVVVSGERIEAVVPDDADTREITIVLRPSRRERERERQAAAQAMETSDEHADEEEPDEEIVVFAYTEETDESDE
jgi:hypothetical protein